MLYLEDYLEMIEHLPGELRDRFTEIRELDLQVHNAMDHLDDEVKQFFSSAKRMKQEVRESEFNKIKSKYIGVLEDAEEKVNLASHMYDLVDRYLRRLDQELDKFKNELEADNAGITEVLERRSHDLDHVPSSGPNHVRRKVDPSYGSHLYGTGNNVTSASGNMSGGLNDRSISNGGSIGNSSAPITLYNANNAIAAAASQALVATTQMQSGRRTASLKASIDAIGLNSYPNFPSDTAFGQSSFGSYGNPLEAGSSRGAWPYEPDEQTYCVCNQVSFGEMVACDNDECEIEWFHYMCVGLSAAPKGKWYCPQCISKINKKRRASERRD